MPDLASGTVRIRFPMEGLEEAQQQMEQIQVEAKNALETLEQEAERVSLTIERSISSAVAALSVSVRVGFDVLEVFGVTIDETLKATINLVLSYATQVALIASANAAINPAYAFALATLAATLQARALQLQAEGAAEAKEALDKSRRLMRDVTQALVIITRT